MTETLLMAGDSVSLIRRGVSLLGAMAMPCTVTGVCLEESVTVLEESVTVLEKSVWSADFLEDFLKESVWSGACLEDFLKESLRISLEEFGVCSLNTVEEISEGEDDSGLELFEKLDLGRTGERVSPGGHPVRGELKLSSDRWSSMAALGWTGIPLGRRLVDLLTVLLIMPVLENPAALAGLLLRLLTLTSRALCVLSGIFLVSVTVLVSGIILLGRAVSREAAIFRSKLSSRSSSSSLDVFTRGIRPTTWTCESLCFEFFLPNLLAGLPELFNSAEVLLGDLLILRGELSMTLLRGEFAEVWRGELWRAWEGELSRAAPLFMIVITREQN
jgi:hypothetical protein